MPDHPRGTEQAGGSVSSETTETPKSRLQVSPHQWALLAIAAAVRLANLPYLLGIFDPNPLHFRSGLVTAITPGWLGGKPTIDPSYGFTSQAIGHRAALDLLHLHLPWWNPYEGTGMPLAGETQAAALFPPTLLTAVSNGQLYEHILLELTAGDLHLPPADADRSRTTRRRRRRDRFRPVRQVRLVRRRHGQPAAVPSHAPARDRVGGRRDQSRPARWLAATPRSCTGDSTLWSGSRFSTAGAVGGAGTPAAPGRLPRRRGALRADTGRPAASGEPARAAPRVPQSEHVDLPPRGSCSKPSPCRPGPT